ncbi:hypothetical protein QOT17_019929 [Balamuthia mandrillaris]
MEEEEEKELVMKEWTLRVRCVDGALRIDAFHGKTGTAKEEESKPWRQLLVLPPLSSRDKQTTQQTFLPARNINRHPGRFLPPEVLLHVFSFLSAFELSLVAALVDMEWYALSQDDHLWRELVLGLSELDDSLLEDPYVAQLSDWKAVYRYLTKSWVNLILAFLCFFLLSPSFCVMFDNTSFFFPISYSYFFFASSLLIFLHRSLLFVVLLASLLSLLLLPPNNTTTSQTNNPTNRRQMFALSRSYCLVEETSCATGMSLPR